MDIASIIALAVIAGLVFYIISIYNHLVPGRISTCC